MKTHAPVIPLLLLALSPFSYAAPLTYDEGQRVFEADMWNEVFGRSYPYNISSNLILTSSGLKGNILTHYMTFYETKYPFNPSKWEEGITAMMMDNFCHKGYIKDFPVILRLKITVKANKTSDSEEMKTLVAESKTICK